MRGYEKFGKTYQNEKVQKVEKFQNILHFCLFVFGA